MLQDAFFCFLISFFLYIWLPIYIPWYNTHRFTHFIYNENNSFGMFPCQSYFYLYSYNLKMLFSLIPWVDMLTHPVFAVTPSHSLSVFLIHVPSLSLRFILLSSRSLYPLILSFLSISVHLHSSLSLSLSLSIFLSLSFFSPLYSLSLLSPFSYSPYLLRIIQLDKSSLMPLSNFWDF